MSILHGLLDGMLQGMNGILGGGAAVPFTPPVIPGLVLWLDPSDPTSYTLVSGGVSQINDKSGNGNNYTQAVAISRPTIGSMNGKGALLFSSQFLNGPTFSTLTAAETFIVIRNSNVPNNIGMWNFADAGAGAEFRPFSNNLYYENFGSSTRKDAIVPIPIPDNTSNRTYNIINTATEYTINEAGSQLFTTGSNVVQWGAITSTIGVNIGGSAFTGLIAEFLIYDHKLTTGERAAVNTYLHNKYQTLDIALSGQVLYLRADLGFNGTTWADQSSNGNNVTAVGTPTLSTMSGRAAINLAGGAYFQNTTSNVVTTGTWTVLAVAKNAAIVNSTGGGAIFATRTTLPYEAFIQYNLGGTHYVAGDGINSGANVTLSTPIFSTIVNPFQTVCVMNGTGIAPTIYVNGVVRAVAAGTQFAESGATGFMVGTNPSVGVQLWNDLISEIRILNHAITADELTAWNNYCTARYGI